MVLSNLYLTGTSDLVIASWTFSESRANTQAWSSSHPSHINDFMPIMLTDINVYGEFSNKLVVLHHPLLAAIRRISENSDTEFC